MELRVNMWHGQSVWASLSKMSVTGNSVIAHPPHKPFTHTHTKKHTHANHTQAHIHTDLHRHTKALTRTYTLWLGPYHSHPLEAYHRPS